MMALVVVFCLAGLLTSLWLGGAVLYIGSLVGWDSLMLLPPSDMAVLVAGTFGPVVALWLLVGFINMAASGHRQEHVLNTLAQQSRHTSDHVEAQVRTLLQMQADSRRQAAVEGMELALRDLNAHASLLAERLGMVSTAEAETLWGRTVSGDVWAFAQAFLVRAAAYPEFAGMLAERALGDPVSVQALHCFIRRCEALRHEVQQHDLHPLFGQVIEEGPLARLHTLFLDLADRIEILRDVKVGSADSFSSTVEDVVRQRVSSSLGDDSSLLEQTDFGDENDPAVPEPEPVYGSGSRASASPRTFGLDRLHDALARMGGGGAYSSSTLGDGATGLPERPVQGEKGVLSREAQHPASDAVV
ncbi:MULTISPECIES: hypothetical protein [unclassified Haematospirillum]|uniref:hypothetical protein n=1 Tax=unclassified Haematospirillum TaxID=2622088 RepID=UPI0014392A2D|nr:MULTISPECIES: hypothetical protein [unclassified Haematospirillum]NKD54591.1 hypothetical protein [Haematospirillum sp. H4890]NKD74797.1 hypothetical protein [Haematospirillum sp. H4485]